MGVSIFLRLPTAYGKTINIAEAEKQLPDVLRQPNRPTAIFCHNDPVADQIIPAGTERD